jgi:hypothetical protein
MIHTSAPASWFLIVGAPKCGTTALADYLEQHPSVYLSQPKEPIFFEAQYGWGLEFYLAMYFRGWAGERAVGEARVYNLYLDYVPERIQESLPDAKLIALLRNPVDRVFSQWWHRVTRAHESRSFDELVEDELRRIARDGPLPIDPASWRSNLYPNTAGPRREPYIEVGYYGRQLERYRELFPEEQIRVVFHEDLARASASVVRDLLRFLDVDPNSGPADFSRRNVARRRQRGRLEGWLARLSWRLGLNRIVPDAVRTGIVRALPAKAVERAPMSQAAAARLARHYRPHDDHLERLLGRPLPWRRQATHEPAPIMEGVAPGG